MLTYVMLNHLRNLLLLQVAFIMYSIFFLGSCVYSVSFLQPYYLNSISTIAMESETKKCLWE